MEHHQAKQYTYVNIRITDLRRTMLRHYNQMVRHQNKENVRRRKRKVWGVYHGKVSSQSKKKIVEKKTYIRLSVYFSAEILCSRRVEWYIKSAKRKKTYSANQEYSALRNCPSQMEERLGRRVTSWKPLCTCAGTPWLWHR